MRRKASSAASAVLAVQPAATRPMRSVLSGLGPGSVKRALNGSALAQDNGAERKGCAVRWRSSHQLQHRQTQRLRRRLSTRVVLAAASADYLRVQPVSDNVRALLLFSARCPV